MTIVFNDFVKLEDIANINLKGQFSPHWNMLYEHGPHGHTPMNSGSGLRLGTARLRAGAEQQLSVPAGQQGIIYILTSDRFPILYVGISKGGLSNGVFGAGRISHHLRKLLAIHNNSTNHTSGWRTHAIERYKFACQNGGYNLDDLCISVATTPNPMLYEGHVLQHCEKFMRKKVPNIEVLNNPLTVRFEEDISLPENISLITGRLISR